MSKPRSHVGDTVRVHRRIPSGHARTPAYIQGHRGRVQHHCGAFPNPEQRAQGLLGEPLVQLYRVRFARADLWPIADPRDRHQSVDVEIYEHWLEGEHD